MKKNYLFFTFVTLLFLVKISFGQSLLETLEDEKKSVPETNQAYATFKSTRLINGQTVESIGKNQANFLVSHRFGNLSMGPNDFWGLDQSFIRLGFEYGITQKLDVGIGRSNDQKLIDGYIKYKVFNQSSGKKNMPITLSWYSAAFITHQPWTNPNRDNLFSSRLSYVHQLIAARKFNDKLSLLIAPGFVHRNLVTANADQNDVPFVCFGGRYKLTNRISLNAEYSLVLPGNTADKYINPLAIGFDIETGGHVFQLHFSNTRGRTEKTIPENLNSWLEGDVGFGFNIVRHFNLKKQKL